MIFSLKKKKKILGDCKRSPGLKTQINMLSNTTNLPPKGGLSQKTLKKIEEQMLKNIITDAREKGGL
jgi:hypothetical protein